MIEKSWYELYPIMSSFIQIVSLIVWPLIFSGTFSQSYFSWLDFQCIKSNEKLRKILKVSTLIWSERQADQINALVRAKASLFQIKRGFADEGIRIYVEHISLVTVPNLVSIQHHAKCNIMQHDSCFFTCNITSSREWFEMITLQFSISVKRSNEIRSVQKELRSESRHHSHALRQLKTSQRAKFVRLKGIPEDKHSVENTVEKVSELLEYLGFQIEERDIERANRVGGSKDEDGHGPRAIVMELISERLKHSILREAAVKVSAYFCKFSNVPDRSLPDCSLSCSSNFAFSLDTLRTRFLTMRLLSLWKKQRPCMCLQWIRAVAWFRM